MCLPVWLVLFNHGNVTLRELAGLCHAAPARESSGTLKNPKSINLSPFTPKIKAGSLPLRGADSEPVLFGRCCCRRFPRTCPSFGKCQPWRHVCGCCITVWLSAGKINALEHGLPVPYEQQLRVGQRFPCLLPLSCILSTTGASNAVQTSENKKYFL